MPVHMCHREKGNDYQEVLILLNKGDNNLKNISTLACDLTVKFQFFFFFHWPSLSPGKYRKILRTFLERRIRFPLFLFKCLFVSLKITRIYIGERNAFWGGTLEA